jgi:AraC-like DNA-binding protein
MKSVKLYYSTMKRAIMPESKKFHTRHTLVESLGISVADFNCRIHDPSESPEEPNTAHSIVFIRRGLFRRKHRGETLLADPNYILFLNAGEPYRYSHPVPDGDDCTILAVPALIALELVARHVPRDAERPEAPFRLGHGTSSRRARWLHYEFLTLVRAGATTLAVEDALSELADEAIRAAYGTLVKHLNSNGLSAHARRRRRDLVEATKLVVNERIDSLPSLKDLARSVDCSPFHLSRVFQQGTGLSLRRYIGRIRTSIAAERLATGERDLTELALDLGYTDHSHFTNSFRKSWGVPPSRFRARISLP